MFAVYFLLTAALFSAVWAAFWIGVFTGERRK
jgi:hypothetical protein